MKKIAETVKTWGMEWRAYLAEFLGTFAFVLLASLVVISDILFTQIGPVGIGLSVGFLYAACLYATNHLAGGFLNPAVTIALWLGQKLSITRTVFLLVAQVAASFTAAGVIYLLFGKGVTEFLLGGPIIGINLTTQTAVFVEAIFTAVLVFCVFATMVDRAGPVSFGPMVIGLLVAAETIIAFPISGAAFNPARAIGHYVISNSYEFLAVWIVGPLTGGLIALLYDFVFLRKRFKAK